MWRETTKHERNMKIFREEIDAWLPERVLDFHVHVIAPEAIPGDGAYAVCGHETKAYDLDELRRDLPEVYPGRETAAVCFGHPYPHYDNAAQDRYLAENCDRRRFFPLRVYDTLEDDPEDVRRDLIEGRFYGIKPYLTFLRKEDPNEVEILEMLPDGIMRVIDELGLIVMLHIPRKGRLADAKNQEQLPVLCERYPNAKIVLAHLGRAYFERNIVGRLDRLVGLENLWFELAMVSSPEVLEYLFRTAPAERILYATDAPIALAPGKSVEINHQYTYVTPIPWELSISDDHGKLTFTSFLYEELRGIYKAVRRLGLGDEFLRAIFRDNGMALLDSVGEGVAARASR